MGKQEFAPEEQKARTITVYNTSGTCETSFKSAASTVAQLKKDLTTKGVPYTGMKMVVGENQEELKEEDQQLLQTDMSLFLTPVKVRSGLEKVLLFLVVCLVFSTFMVWKHTL